MNRNSQDNIGTGEQQSKRHDVVNIDRPPSIYSNAPRAIGFITMMMRKNNQIKLDNYLIFYVYV